MRNAIRRLPGSIFPLLFLLPVAAPAVGQAVAASAIQPAPAAPRDAQALQWAQQAIAALGGAPVADVTLSAAATWGPPGRRQSGAAVLEAQATSPGLWSSRVDWGGGQLRETYAPDARGMQRAQWSGSDSAVHARPAFNAFVPAAWFFPLLSPLGGLGDAHTSVTYIGPETRSGVAVQHLRFSRVALAGTPSALKLVARLSQVELYLDAQTSLPVALVFQAHPDNAPRYAIPVEIRYSDYRPAPGGGGQMPFHIERRIGGGLDSTFDINGAKFNTGLPASEFSLP